MKKTDQEIEKMLLNDLEETIVMGWADTSEKSLLLELIRERQVKNNIALPDVRGQLIAFLREQTKLHYVSIYENDFEFADKILKAINLP